MPLFIVRHEGVRGAEHVLHRGRVKRDAVAVYAREVAKVTQGLVTLRRVENGVAEVLMRCEAIPLQKVRKRGRRHHGGRRQTVMSFSKSVGLGKHGSSSVVGQRSDRG